MLATRSPTYNQMYWFLWRRSFGGCCPGSIQRRAGHGQNQATWTGIESAWPIKGMQLLKRECGSVTEPCPTVGLWPRLPANR